MLLAFLDPVTEHNLQDGFHQYCIFPHRATLDLPDPLDLVARRDPKEIVVRLDLLVALVKLELLDPQDLLERRVALVPRVLP